MDSTFQLENFSFLPVILIPFGAFFVIRIFQDKLISSFNAAFTNQSFRNAAKDFFSTVDKSPRRVRLVCLGLCFIAFAILQPKWGFKPGKVNRRGTDLVLAVDVSDSMLTDDVSPNRLTRAKREILDLIEHLKGDRIGLVSFSGSAIPEVPLTVDYEAFKGFLEILDPELSPVKGSNISAALLTSFEMLIQGVGARSREKDKAVILITDGEDFTGDYAEVKAQAAKDNIGIFVVGIGTEKGAAIKTENGYKRNKKGEIVISKLQLNALKELAEKTGGEYVTSVGSDSDTVTIYDKGIRQKLKTRDIANKDSRLWNQYFQIPLLIGLALIFWGWSGGLILITLVIFTPSFALADPKQALALYSQGDFKTSEQSFNSLELSFESKSGIASSKYRSGDFIGAFEAFTEASKLAKNRTDRAESYYNAGNSLAQIEKYKEAIALYQESLKLNSNDTETKENLEYLKKLLKEKQENPPEQQNSSSEQSSSSSSRSSEQSSSSSEQKSSDTSDQSSSSSKVGSDYSENSSSKDKSAEESSSSSKESSSSQKNSSSSNETSSSTSSSSSSLSASSRGDEESKEDEGTEQVLSQLYNVEEIIVPNYSYRLKKSIEQLKKLKLGKPENDW